MAATDKARRGLSRLKQRFAGHPQAQEKFQEQVRPIIKDVRSQMEGQPEEAVYAELSRRLAAAGIKVPQGADDNLHNVAGRISRRERRAD